MNNAFRIKKGLLVNGSGSTVVDIQGNSGQLFSVTDSLTGSLMSVNDISGLPILEVFSDDTVKMGTFGAEGLIVTGSNVILPNTTNATGSFLTRNSSTGLVSLRTPAEVLTDIGAQAALTNPVTGTGTSGQVSFWNGTTTQTGDNGLWWDNTNGRLGIGTTSPSSKLEVTGNAAIGYTNAAPTNGMIVAGSVGIGTATPQRALEVISGANNFVSVGVGQIGVGQFTGIHFGYRENNNLYRKSAIVFERTDLTSNNAQGKVHILNGPQGNANNATLADARLTIAENGNVGIGTTSPSQKLHVSDGNILISSTAGGDRELTITTTTAGNAAINLNASTGGVGRIRVNNFPLVFDTNSTERMRITSAGNVGVGITSPTYGLVVGAKTANSATGTMFVSAALNGSGKGLVIDSTTRGTGDNAVLALEIINRAGGNTMSATVAGDVGVGTTTPSTKLHVVGNARIDGTLGIRASSTSSTATQFPVFTADPSSTTRTLVTRTPAQVLSDIGAAPSSGSANYIQNQNASAQSANFRITGEAVATRFEASSTLTVGWDYTPSFGFNSAVYIRGRSGAGSSTIPFTDGAIMYLGNSADGADRMWVDAYGHGFFRGTLQINTINNGVGDFLTKTSTGVVTKRTAAEVLTDIGAQAALTNPVTGTGTTGQVSFWNGTTTQTGDTGFLWDSTSGAKNLIIRSNNSNDFDINLITIGGNSGWADGTFGTERIGVTSGLKISSFSRRAVIDLVRLTASATSEGELRFSTALSSGSLLNRWNILGSGIFESVGAQTIRTSTGALTLATNGGNGNIILSPNGTGKVGINTTSPQFRLHVLGTSPGNDTASEGILIENNNVTAGEAALAFRVSSTPSSNYWFTGNNQANAYDIGYGTSFFNAGTALRITTDLRVGIGAITPSEKLHVVGNGLFTGTLEVDTVNNGVGDFLTRTSGGIITRRTAAEVLSDIGAPSTTNTVSVTGTTNQVIVTGTTSQQIGSNPAWTLSLPQDIHTAAKPTFSGATFNGAIELRAPSTTTPATQFPIFTADPSSTTRALVTRTPAQVLTDIGAQAALTNPVTGTGANGRVAFWTGTNTQSSDTGLFWDNVNKRLGIGTTTPEATLTVGPQSTTNSASGNSDLVRFGKSSAGTELYALTLGNISTATTNSAVTLAYILADNFGTTATIKATLMNSGTALTDLSFSVYDGTTTNERVRIYGNAGVLIKSGGTTTGTALNVTNSTPTSLLFVRDDGNVGINTTSPGSKLDIRGTVRVGDPGAGTHIATTNPSISILSTSTDNTILRLGTVGGSTTYFDFFRNNTNGSLNIQGAQTGANNIALVPTSGNVGIGINTPSHKLHVNGDVRINSTASPPAIQNITPSELYTNTALYTAMGTPDEWLKININGSDYSIPAYSF